jgi:hypothetical protein
VGKKKRDTEKREKEKVATQAEMKRLVAQSTELHRLTTVPAMKVLSPKRHDKLLTQLNKVDRAIAKMAKIAS